MLVFRSFHRIAVITFTLVLPQIGLAEEAGRCTWPDDLQLQISEALGEPGADSRACPDPGGDDENMQALEQAAMAIVTARGNSFLAPIIDASLELGQNLLAELAHSRIRDRAEFPEGKSEAFQAAWALEEGHHNTEAAFAFKSLLSDSPDNADLQAAFLRNCYLAADGCPPLWPEQRSRIPEWSCTEAVNLAVEHFERAFHAMSLRDAEEKGLPEEEAVSTVAAFSFELTDWIIPAAMHAGGMLAFIEGAFRETPALGVVLNDPIMHCNRDRDMAVLIRHGFGAPGETYHDLMRPVMRDNLLDVAWRVLDYQLPQGGGADEDLGQDE